MTEATAIAEKDGHRIGRLRRPAIIACLLLILSAAGAALYLIYNVDTQIGDIVRAYDVRRAARDLSISLMDQESGQRGYLLTRDPMYLDPYESASAMVEGQVSRLLDLTQNNAPQRLKIVGILDKIDQKQREMARTIDLAKSGQAASAQTILDSDVGAGLMTDIRQVIDQFTDSEDAQLEQRNAAVMAFRLALVIAVLVALAGAGSLTYVLFVRSQRQVSDLARNRAVLLNENEVLEARVRERTADLEDARRHADRERTRVETMLQDTNHRIGNSLATVSSMLGLQLMRTTSPEIREALEAARDRVQAIASGHRRLRLGDDLETIRADEFLSAVFEDIENTRRGTTPVKFAHGFEPLVIMARDGTTLGIILGELVTNALKHAFPDGRGGTITALFTVDVQGCMVLTVKDDGVGMREGASEQGGLGSLIIKQLARQFNGTATYASHPQGGTSVSVALPGLQPRDD